MNLDRLLRKHLKGLKPYQSARDEYTGREGIFLDANENPLGSATEEAFNRYPDPYQQEVKAALALVKLIREPYIFLGNGSDEAIDLLYRAFCEPGEDHVILLPPTYGMYKVSAQINGVDIREVSLAEDFQLDVEAIRARVSPMTKLIFICSPNNPTGNLMDREAIRQVIEMAPGLVVVDEAYADFAPDQSVLHWVREYPNLVVLQTFSKAWGLANLRLGMAFADPAIIQILNQIKPPYNVNGLTQRM
ncbi:MAG: aminotransferase class I/II-fold pyridoxal phosphate-dependent enzyme, partial [Bacteroidota bacterium]